MAISQTLHAIVLPCVFAAKGLPLQRSPRNHPHGRHRKPCRAYPQTARRRAHAPADDARRARRELSRHGSLQSTALLELIQDRARLTPCAERTWSPHTRASSTGRLRMCRRATLAGRFARRSLCWKRTKRVTVDGMPKRAFHAQNYKLTEERGGEGDGREDVVAAFTSSSARREIRRMHLNVDRGREFDVLAWMTCLTIYWSGQ